jgi:hypothetical protein
VRKLAFIAAFGAALFGVVAVSYAITNSISYTSKSSNKVSPKKGKPSPLKYTGTLKVTSKEPANSQPDVAPRTTVFYDKNMSNHAADFPSCKTSDIDGKRPFPSKCKSAVVGSGTAIAHAASGPGVPLAQTVEAPLKVTAVNGPKGKSILLVVDGTQPVDTPNRVIPGKTIKASGKYGFASQFDVPAELQNQLGLNIALTDFSVTIKDKTIKNKKGQKVSYLMLNSCPKNKTLNAKATTQFKNAQSEEESATATSKCK